MAARTVMHDEYGGLLRRFFEWAFGPLQYPREAAEQIRLLAKRGTIVYVARARSSILGLYFNHALYRFGLPLARFVGGINLFLFQPVDRLWRLWVQRRQHEVSGRRWQDRFPDRPPKPAEALLMEITLRGQASFLFLPPPRERDRLARFRLKHDYFRALVAAQRSSSRPIFIVPHVLVGRSQSGTVRGAWGTRFFGSGRKRGRLREIALLLSPQHANLRVAEPIDVQSFLTADGDDQHQARRLAHELNRRISEEERVVAGPSLPAFDTTKRHVLRNPMVREALEEAAKAAGKSVGSLERRADRLLDEIAARYNVNTIRFMDALMRWIFNRIYDGITVDEDGLARALLASKRGPLVFCPSHKSHVDYLVLSYILWQHNVAPPHIAAGANLSFFPLGAVFRRAGAFFLRRTFKDDALYRALFRAYVTELVATGTSIEFFMEGTRSRTGKLLLPKFGLLGMLVDSWRQAAREDLVLVPVSIDYERIIEAGSYERELLGGEKKPEDIGALLGATRVLRSRYGRVHVQFGEPLSLADEMRRGALPQSAEPQHDDRFKEEIERLGYRVLYRVGQVCTVTPTAVAATALLSHRGRGLALTSLLAACDDIIDYLDAQAARLSDTLRAQSREASILEALQKLVDEGTLRVDRPGRSDAEPIYRVIEDRRIILDFQKNALMNYFAPGALLARSLLRRKESPASYKAVHADTRFLSKLLKREFIYRVDADYDTHFDDALATLAVRGMLDVEDDAIVVRNRPALELLSGLLDSFVEAYLVTAQTLVDLRQFPLWDKELLSRALERARRAFLEGAITRPEAASRTLVENALAWMIEGGVLDVKLEGKKKRLQLKGAHDGPALEKLIAQIASYS